MSKCRTGDWTTHWDVLIFVCLHVKTVFSFWLNYDHFFFSFCFAVRWQLSRICCQRSSKLAYRRCAHLCNPVIVENAIEQTRLRSDVCTTSLGCLRRLRCSASQSLLNFGIFKFHCLHTAIVRRWLINVCSVRRMGKHTHTPITHS